MGQDQGQSADEIFDVVDGTDRVVGQARRGDVHRLGLRHRAVHVLVGNAAGEVFLQKRSLQKDSAPGKWDSSASGHLDAGEAYDDTAAREVAEELGLPGQRPERLFYVEESPETGREFVWVYGLRHEGPFNLPPAEIETGAWFAPEDVDAWLDRAPGDFARAFRLIWGRWRAAYPTSG